VPKGVSGESKQPVSRLYDNYLKTKSKYKDAILFYRIGDFYEVIGDDAKTAAKVLDLTLTSRGFGESRIPMCGVPYHALDRYIALLVKEGYKVAIAEKAS